MSAQTTHPRRIAPELRNGLVFGGLMLMIPLAAKLSPGLGWGSREGLADRSLMVLLGLFIASIGNTIPKRLAPLAGLHDPAQAQSFYRFAGWTWVLTGLALGLAWLVLPLGSARTATFVVLPLGIALIALRCVSLRFARPRAE